MALAEAGRAPQMPHPACAPVTPRACAAPDGEPLPLHDHVRRLLSRRAKGLVNVFGPRGSGKSTALRHLAAVLPPDADVVLLDDKSIWFAGAAAHAWVTGAASGNCLVVFASRSRTDHAHLAAFRMAPWTADDAIEYLLATYPDRCPSVMARVKDALADAATATRSIPELWRIVLDQMIASDAVATPVEALRHFLASRLGDDEVRQRTTDYCLMQALTGHLPGNEIDPDPPSWFERADPLLARLIGYFPVQVLLAAQRIVWDLGAGNGRDHLHRRLPGEVLQEVAALAAFREPVMDELRWLLRSKGARRAHPTAASILHATGTGWRPEGCKPNLSCASLAGAQWAGVDLAGADLSAAHLATARLNGARLDDANVASTDLAGASLRGASLKKLRAANAVLAGADLSAARAGGAEFDMADLCGADLSAATLAGANFTGADLTAADLSAATLAGANFTGADLTAANLRGSDLQEACLNATKLAADLAAADLSHARLTRVDLTDARLQGAKFRDASLLDCDLQGVEMTDAVFELAKLLDCDLAGSVLPRADFRDAVFHGAGLAHVRWENADLRGADLTGASFHTGSSRSGLVGSTIASEGTRTGFYTDDYDDRGFKPPEEIRTANLCGADLRGAKVDQTDFYLVDLRGARYTDGQAHHFRRCGAIL
jgi:uncharacterized protein YjbI with pentapeptide repeats